MRRLFEHALAAVAVSAAISCGGTSFTASGSGTGGTHSGDSGVGGASGSGANAGTGGSGTGSGAGGGIAAGGSKSSGGAAGSGGRPSTGGASSGGVSSGGAGGRGGTAGNSSGGASGAGGAPTCGPDLTFKMIPGGPAAMAQFCTSAPNTCAGLSITVLDADGQVVAMDLGCNMQDCALCVETACPAICAFSMLIPSTGLGFTWSGTRWLPGTCGENVACYASSCAAHGTYVARMCGYAMTGTAGAGGAGGIIGPMSPCEQLASKTPTCVDVPFEYPSSGVVSGVLDPRK